MGLGSLRTFNLEEARERARKARQQLADGLDPIDQRDRENRARNVAEVLEKARSVLFEEAAEQFVAFHGDKWRNAKHRAQFMSTLRQYAFPYIGKVPVGEIDKALVLKVLDPIWRVIPETANRVRGRIEVVLNFATVRGYRSGENPARGKGYLDHALPIPHPVSDGHPSSRIAISGTFSLFDCPSGTGGYGGASAGIHDIDRS